MNTAYFSRCATWNLMDGRLVVNDSSSPRAPRMITMEPWHEVVFGAADGEHTVDEFVEQLGREYEGGPPQGLRAQIVEIIAVLVGEGIVKTHATPKPLPIYLAEDYFAQPPEVRKAQMQADGFIRTS
jgi:hypothetical protein